jgi:hypothetical protein
MKKLILAVLLSFSFIFLPFIEQSEALETSAGLSTWYCWWKSMEENNDMNLKPALLYGPVLSLRFDESWSLAGVFLYGLFKPENKDSERGVNDISRFDSDLSLNYNINRYFKLFGGGKFMGYKWDNSGNNSSGGTHWSVGPGLGIGTTLPLTQSWYLLFNVSGTYSWGKHDETGGGSSSAKTTVNINERGFNTNLSFAYYFASASTSVNLGFRYQYLYIDYSKESNSNEGGSKDEAISFYGVTLSAVYSF